MGQRLAAPRFKIHRFRKAIGFKPRGTGALGSTAKRFTIGVIWQSDGASEKARRKERQEPGLVPPYRVMSLSKRSKMYLCKACSYLGMHFPSAIPKPHGMNLMGTVSYELLGKNCDYSHLAARFL